MHDRMQRRIDYMRISLTDRCNLRCLYCMPPEGVVSMDHSEILRLEEVHRIVRIAVKLGITKFRLTGGEPLVRKGILDLIRQMGEIPGLKDLSLTTNGILLGPMAKELKEAGLNRVNISLDTIRPERFSHLTRGGDLNKVLEGIDAALVHGLGPVKLNMVVMGGFNSDELGELARLTMNSPLHVRFIELMPVGEGNKYFRGEFVSVDGMKKQLAAEGLELAPVGDRVSGNGPAKYWTLPGAVGTVGFIHAISNHFCGECNRIRLTADGKLRPCLHSQSEIDLREPLRQEAADEELADLLASAILDKPESHTMKEEGWGSRPRRMSQIGG